MNSVVKEEIIEWISKPENEELLETLKLIKENASTEDWYDDLSDSEKESIERGIKDHKQGNALTSKEFWKRHG